jgi:hypothetical protein
VQPQCRQPRCSEARDVVHGAGELRRSFWTLTEGGRVSQVVRLIAGSSSSGAPAYEEVLVESKGDSRFLLLRSPGLAVGLAAGDVFELGTDGTFKVLTRGRNVCIQIFGNRNLDPVERESNARLGPLGARLDGRAAKELVYTVSVDVGFPAIEEALRHISERFPDVEWYYGNVYDPADGVTPLNWWLSGPQEPVA